MKKLVCILTILFFLSGVTVFAATAPQVTGETSKKVEHKTETITGKIISIDGKTNEIAVKINKTNEERKFIVNSQTIASLKVNEEVRVKFEAGSNIAQHVKVIKKQNKMTENKGGCR